MSDATVATNIDETEVGGKTMKRSTLILLILAGVVAVSTGGYFSYRYFSKAAPLKFETANVDKGPITSKVTATGTLSALVTVQVGSQVSGRLKEIRVDFNSPVKKGQILAVLDPQLFTAALEQARANHFAAQGDAAAAQARALDAQRQLARVKGLMEKQLIAQADVDTAQANAEAATAQVQSANGRIAQTRAALAQAQVNLDYTTITSPINGLVVSRNVDVGQTVAASLQAPVLFLLAEDLSKMQVDTSVSEADIGKLAPGMKATFTVDAYPNEKFAGTVRQLRNAPQVVQNVVTYDAVVDVDNPALKLKPGMTANVSFVSAEKTDVIRIPNAALRFRPTPEFYTHLRGEKGKARSDGAERKSQKFQKDDTGKKSVWRLTNGTPERVTVTLGITDGTVTEATSDTLNVDDALITDATSTETSAAPRSQGLQGNSPGGGMRRVF